SEIEVLKSDKRTIEASVQTAIESAKFPLKNKISELENNLKNFTIQSQQDLSGSVVNFENRIADLKSELTNKDVLINKINANLTQFDQILTNTKNDNEKAMQEISSLKAENNSLKAKNKDIELSTQRKIVQSTEPLLKQIELAENKLKSNDAISKERERTIKNMLSEKDILNSKLEDIKKERNDLSTKLYELDNKVKLETKLNKDQLFDLNKLREDLKITNKNTEIIKNEKSELSKKISALANELASKDARVPEQITALKMQNKKDIEALRNQIISAENIVKEKTAEIFKITDEKNQIRSNIFDLEGSNKSLIEEINSLKNTISKLEGSSENIELAKLPLKEKINELNLAFSDSETDKKAMTVTIRNLNQKIDDLNKDISLILSEKIDLNDSISTIKKQNAEETEAVQQRSVKELNQLNNEIQQLKNELASTRTGKLDVVNETTERMRKELNVLKNELEDSSSIIKNKDYKIKSLYDNISDLESKLEKKLSENENSSSNTIQFKKEIKRLNESLESRVQSEKAPLIAEVNSLRSELKQMDRLVRVKVEETRESLQKQLSALEQQLKSNEIAILEKDNTNVGLAQEVIKLNANIDQLVSDKTSIQKALYSLTDKYEKTIKMYKNNVSELETINSNIALDKKSERSIKSEIDEALKLIESYK
ncbi:MAG: hypothetical protein KJ736_03320, partial [Candidatus Omnitrophica bacterium]|nr:hypothetical protein [Candidatus Omnitrophota bacterium]